MNLYKTIKDRVTTRQAAEHYGLHVNHNGMARCPFHEDHTPSLKLDERYYCFGCGATGDVIDFIAGLFGLSTKDAAEKLITDFGLDTSHETRQFHSPPEKNAEQFPDRERLCIRVFRDYLRLLNIWSVKYRPESSDELFHDRFVEAVTYLPEVNHILDCLLSNDRALVQKTDEDFLLKLGAVGIGKDGQKHPTSAGLLMFGNEYDIVREYNTYFLDYQEQYDADTRWTDRVISSSGDWSGNVYDFYFRVYNKLTQDIKVPFKLDGGTRVDDTPVHQALREALANCLVNADYYGRQGLVVVKKKDSITLSNPGGFRIEIDAAKSGGISYPRNGTMLKMFNLIDIGERAGSGIPNIFRVWREEGWAEPKISESFEPARITLSLKTEKTGDKKSAIKGQLNSLLAQQTNICEYLEKGIYTVEMFEKRNTVLSKQIKQLQSAEADLLYQQSEEGEKKRATSDIIPTTQHILDNYAMLSTAEKNQLWKMVMKKAEVYRSPEDKLTVNIYPNLPK